MTNQGDAAWEAFAEELQQYQLGVRRESDPPLFTREPVTTVQAYRWKWPDIVRFLHRATEVVAAGGASGAERRTLRLVNPGLPYGTTHTLWAAIQAVAPGEVANAHRHSAAALRFIIQGDGASTTVNGERYPMQRGDFLITPAWAWHDHRNDSAQLTYWLDCLDIPLMRMLQSSFFELHSEPQQRVLPGQTDSLRRYGSGILRPAKDGPKPLLGAVPVYPFREAYAALKELEALDPDPYDDVALEYINPTTGGHVMPTIACYIQLLRPGVQTRAHRHTHSALYHVVEGQGQTIVNGQALQWEAGDFIAVPPWAWHEHRNLASTKEAVLFSVTDRPVYEALGYDREEGR